MPKKRYHQKTFTPISALIEKIVHQYRPHNEPALLRVWDIWQEAVGPEIAASARPIAFKGSLLMIHVDNSSLLHRLRFLEKNLIAQINTALGAEHVVKVKFKIGSF
jgi:predicted nucleic acid-binding Zn ribbon protein